MTKTTAIRIYTPNLATSLRAVAPFIDTDKRSHRHRINLAVHAIPVKDTSERHLFVAAGNASSAIIVDAGKIEGLEDFVTDITPAGAAVIVKFFGGKESTSVSLTLTDRTLRVSSVDRLFDNQSIEIRTRTAAKGTDSVAVMRRVLAWTEPGEPKAASAAVIAIAGQDLQRLAAASKAMGYRFELSHFLINDSACAVARIGSAVAVVNAVGRDVMTGFASLEEQDGDVQWLVDDSMQLRNLLTETTPTAVGKSDTDAGGDNEDQENSAGPDGDDELIDLDAPAFSVVPNEADAA